MLPHGPASLVAKANSSLPAASMIAGGAALTSRPSRATSGHISRRVCTHVVTPLVSVATAVADGDGFIPTPNDFH